MVLELIKEARFLIHSKKTDKAQGVKYEIDVKDKEKINIIVQQLKEKGYCVIENYYSPENCSQLRAEIDKLVTHEENLKIEGGDFRQYGAERLSAPINEFNKDSYLNNIGNEFHANKSVPFFTLAARINYTPGALGSGGGWHRDTFRPHQYKAMVYLNDVDDANGPFQYVEGTHKPSSLFKGIMNVGQKFNSHRLGDEEVFKFIKMRGNKLITFTAKQGTLIVFNSFAIHRGKPLTGGQRYALTNYYFQKHLLDGNEENISKKFKLPSI